MVSRDLAYTVTVSRSVEHEPRTRVLVVDDDNEVAEALGRKLTYVGYAVEVATEPDRIIERIQAWYAAGVGAPCLCFEQPRFGTQ